MHFLCTYSYVRIYNWTTEWHYKRSQCLNFFFPVSLVAFQENITTPTTILLQRRRKSQKSQIIVLLNARILMQLLNVALVLAEQNRKKPHNLAGYTHTFTHSFATYLCLLFYAPRTIYVSLPFPFYFCLFFLPPTFLEIEMK